MLTKYFLITFLLLSSGMKAETFISQPGYVLNSIQTAAVSSFFHEKDPAENATLYPAHETLKGKETYVWASFFNSHSNAELMHLLNRWKIRTLFLSVTAETDRAKLKEFQKMAASRKMDLHYLIGENSYVTSDHGFEDLLVLLNEAESLGFKGVHLDIEPHTFDDYEEETELYVKRQISLFEKAAEWSSLRNIKLSASVPMHLPAAVAASLYRHRVTAYIMAYDYLSLETKILKTQQIRSILKNRYRWVFHLEDFSGIKELADAEKTLRVHHIKAFSYYDLSQMENFGR